MAEERGPGPKPFQPPGGAPEALSREQRGTAGRGVTSELEADALRYRLLARHLRAVAFQLDARGRFTVLGASWQQLTGWPVATTLGTSLVEAVHPLEREQVERKVRSLVARELDSFQEEVRLVTRGGTRWVELLAETSPAALGEVVGLVTDISQRRDTQQTVVTRERCLSAVVEVQRRLLAHESEGTLYPNILEPLCRAVTASRAYILDARHDDLERLLVTYKAEWCMPGVSGQLGRPELKDLRLEELLRTDHALLLSAGQPLQFLASECPPRLQTALAARQVRATLLLPLRLHGELTGFLGFDNCKEARLWEEGIVSLLAGAAGALSLALEQRTTDALRERTEATLRSTEAGLHLLIEGFPEPVLVHAENRVLYVNPATVRYLGHEGPETLVRRPVLMLVRPEDHSAMLRHISKASEGEAARVQEVRLVRKDGQEVVADLATLRVTFDGRPALATIARDFTERKQLQARLMLADRMASMGTLAAGIAHEMNNPLAYVIANLDFVHGRRCSPALRRRSRVDGVAARCWARRARAPSGCGRSSASSSPSPAWRGRTEAPVDVHRVLDSVAQMAASEVRAPRAAGEGLRRRAARASATRASSFQVFLNLLINAAQASPRATAEHERDPPHHPRGRARPGGGGGAGHGQRHPPGAPARASSSPSSPPSRGRGHRAWACRSATASSRAWAATSPWRATWARAPLPRGAAARHERHVARCRSRARAGAAPTARAHHRRRAGRGRRAGPHARGARVDIADGGAVGQERLLREPGYDIIFCDLLMPGAPAWTSMRRPPPATPRWPTASSS